MPQMSSLMWFNLYIYFMLTLLMIMMLIYYLNMFYLNKMKKNSYLYIFFKKKW